MPVRSLADGAVRILPFALGTMAVAGLVHIGTIFAVPRYARDDAFARIAALGPLGHPVVLPPATGGRLPSRDPSMTSVACRYDLTTGPFRIAVGPLSEGFLSIGVHSRHGIAFYGLNLRAGEGGRLDLVLLTEQQKTDTDAASGGAAPHQLTVVAPEQQGFVVIDTPTDGPGHGRAALDAVICGAAPLPEPAGQGS